MRITEPRQGGYTTRGETSSTFMMWAHRNRDDSPV